MSEFQKSYDFIVGIPRSGTTLLGLRLNKIPGVISALENRLLLKVIQDFKENTSDLKSTEKYLRRVFNNQHKFPFTINDEVFEVCEKRNGNSVREIMELILQYVRFDGVDYDHSVQHIVEKNPGYSLLWRKLKEHFPEAKFVWMTRDPRGFVNSRLEKVNPKNKINNVYFLTYLWNEYHKEFLKLKAEVSSLQVKYEDLVTEPNKELKRIIDHFEWSSDVELAELIKAENYSSKIDLDNQRKVTKYKDLDRGINAKRVDAWKFKLSGKQIKDIAFLCGKMGGIIGYDLKSDISFVRKIYLKTCTLHWLIGAKLFVILSKRK